MPNNCAPGRAAEENGYGQYLLGLLEERVF
jgi:hypothetical protein